jgi:hypothetical protein
LWKTDDLQSQLTCERLSAPIKGVPAAAANKMSEDLPVWYLGLQRFDFRAATDSSTLRARWFQISRD